MYCRKLQNGKWTCTADASPDPKTGKRRQVTRRRNTKREAQQAVLQGIREINDQKPSEMTIRELYEEWMTVYRETVRPSTLSTKQTNIRSFIDFFGDYLLVQVTTRDIQDFLIMERDRGLTRRYLGNKKTVYSMLFQHAVDHKYIKENPVDLVVTPREHAEVSRKTRQKKRYLEHNEIKSLLRTALRDKRTYLYRLIVISLSTGLRISELLGLKWKDIDFDKRVLEVKRTLTLEYGRGAAEYVLTPPKTEKSNRFVSFNEQTASLLKKMKVEYNELALLDLLPTNSEWSDLIFLDLSKEEPLNLTVIGKQINQLYEKAGISNVAGFHILRHTHVTMLVEAGVEIPLIMQRMGHSDSAVTLEVYSHVTQKMKSRADNKMNEFFANFL